MRWRIRYQLLVPLAILLLGVAGISTWTAAASAARAREQLDDHMRRVARTLNEASFPLNRTTLTHMKRLSGADFILLDSSGAREDTFPPGEAVELPPADAVVDDWATLRLEHRVAVGGQTYLVSGVRLREARPDRAATLYVLYPEALWRDARWEAVRPSLVLGGFAGLASVVLALGLGGRLARRLGQVERRTRAIADGDFSPMPLPAGDDEVRDLARSINEMAERLARLHETMRQTERLRLLGQVSGGLAHQLRNGVAGARLALQLHATECQAEPEALQVALRQLTLVEANLKRFLDLGRAEGGRHELCSLAGLVDEAMTLLGPQCRHARIQVRREAAQTEVMVRGDVGQLGQLLLNVLGNAVEAAGPGGTVEVRLATADALAVLEVWDSGPGPAADIADRLFEPFVTGKREGVGLGLAVARQVAEAHGGQLTWKREAGRTCFVLSLPRTAADQACRQVCEPAG